MINQQRIEISQSYDVVEARQRGRELAAQLGFSTLDQVMIATAISEMARNIVSYAGHGHVLIGGSPVGGKIMIEAHDSGPGIPDIARAMQDGFSTGKSLGLGLPGSRRLMDEFEIESKVGRGTIVRMAKKRFQ